LKIIWNTTTTYEFAFKTFLKTISNYLFGHNPLANFISIFSKIQRYKGRDADKKRFLAKL